MSIEIKIIKYEEDYKKSIRYIREQVFINEQKISSELEFDGLDNEALHILVFEGTNAIATGRMLEDGHIGRIAVLSKHRSQNIGSKIITKFIEESKQKYYKRLYLSAQIQTIKFYEKLGFTIFGDTFMEANIEHQSMEIILK